MVFLTHRLFFHKAASGWKGWEFYKVHLLSLVIFSIAQILEKIKPLSDLLEISYNQAASKSNSLFLPNFQAKYIRLIL